MFGFVPRRDPATGGVNVTRLTDLIRACDLLVVIVTVSLASPRPGTDGARGLAIAVALGLSAAAWVAWMLSGSTGERTRLNIGSLIVMAGAGGVLAGLSPNSPAVAPTASPAIRNAATVSATMASEASVRSRTPALKAAAQPTATAGLLGDRPASAPPAAPITTSPPRFSPRLAPV